LCRGKSSAARAQLPKREIESADFSHLSA
jgi:hypothetical protein